MVGNALARRALTLVTAVAVLVAGAALLLVTGGIGADANALGADPSEFVQESPATPIAGAPGEFSGVAVNGDTGAVFVVVGVGLGSLEPVAE